MIMSKTIYFTSYSTGMKRDSTEEGGSYFERTIYFNLQFISYNSTVSGVTSFYYHYVIGALVGYKCTSEVRRCYKCAAFLPELPLPIEN